MAVRLTLTSPISVPNIRFVDFAGKVIDDPDTGELQVTLTASLAGNIPVPFIAACLIKNGQAEGLRATVSPTGASDCIEKFATTSGVASAYTQCKADYQSGGRSGLLTRMQTLGLLPAGSIA